MPIYEVTNKGNNNNISKFFASRSVYSFPLAQHNINSKNSLPNHKYVPFVLISSGLLIAVRFQSSSPSIYPEGGISSHSHKMPFNKKKWYDLLYIVKYMSCCVKMERCLKLRHSYIIDLKLHSTATNTQSQKCMKKIACDFGYFVFKASFLFAYFVQHKQLIGKSNDNEDHIGI